MRRGDEETEYRGDNLISRAESFDSASPRLTISASPIDWAKVRRVLVVRLRSIGDTVLATSSLIALKRFLPNAQIDVLLEDWVAPLLDGLEEIHNVITVGRGIASRLRTARKIRGERYDVVFNLHGGTTATFFTFASGARHKIGYSEYQYSFLYNHLLTSSSEFWQCEMTHSAEQQLALLGFVGVPVKDRPKSRLAVTGHALESLKVKFNAETQSRGEDMELFPDFSLDDFANRAPNSRFVLFHPAAAFDTKRWAAANFARIAEMLNKKGLSAVAVAARNERVLLDDLQELAGVPILIFDNLTLPEITALASRAELFVGNDSGIAHIAAAVGTPSVVIFGSSNVDHWRPWTAAPSEIVRFELPCQPCAGYRCELFDEPRCIQNVSVTQVFEAIEKVLVENKKRGETLRLASRI